MALLRRNVQLLFRCLNDAQIGLMWQQMCIRDSLFILRFTSSNNGKGELSFDHYLAVDTPFALCKAERSTPPGRTAVEHYGIAGFYLPLKAHLIQAAVERGMPLDILYQQNTAGLRHHLALNDPWNHWVPWKVPLQMCIRDSV